MLTYPQIDPAALKFGPFDFNLFGHAFSLGPLAIHWYGLTYLAAFGLFLLLALLRLRHEPFASVTGPGAWTRKDVEDMLFLGVVGVIIGGRLGYVVFYNPLHYLSNPLETVFIWRGGMSFHGGMLGVIASQWWFAHSRGKPFWQVLDFIAPCVPTGLAAGRIGNFINGELWGRAADPALPWAMVFPGSDIARHPSQIYQFLLEGLLLFVVLWLYARKERKPAQVSAAFLFGYGVLRFVAEYFREPDKQLIWLKEATGLSMGQWLCVPMIVGGALLWIWAEARHASVPPAADRAPRRT